MSKLSITTLAKDANKTTEAPDAPVSLFRTGARSRSLARSAQAADSRVLAAGDFDQKPWGLLYRALVNSLGTSPSNFQLIYPFTTWTWPTQSAGFISAAQYDFCSVAPQWSAVGAFVSSGDRINQAYSAFLDVILAATDDPKLREEIRVSGEALTNAANDYTVAVNQASTIYGDQVQDNKPTFTEWLATPQGRGYSIKIDAAYTRLSQAQINYNVVVAKANTPGLADAQAQFANTDFYSRLSDPGLSKFPLVPYFQVSQNAAAWVDAVKAGSGPGGATMGFTNREASYDYSKTWAGTSLSISQFFWEVQVSGSWERVTEFETDNELEVSLEFEAIDLIGITPSDWYNGSFVRSHATGPFTRGYSAYGGDGTQAVFGKTGFFNLLKTGMYVGYKPNFTIRVSKASYSRFQETFKAATGLRIGPFTFSAEGGSVKAGWTANEAGQSFTGTTTSDAPLILGVSIAQMPANPDGNLELTTAEQLGNVYRFEGGEGDIIARNVSEREAEGMGGHWHAPAQVAAVTPLRNVRIAEQGPPFTAVINGPDAEMQLLDGVLHVSVIKPFNTINGGPDHVHYYRIRATNALTNQPVDLQNMRFGGIAPFTGAARFADQ